ncbi:diaminopimelate decarboxylase [bacterium]|nr:diaminopimelate decarboxylase [bacterium]
MEKNIEVIFGKFFGYKRNRFYVEDVPVRDIVEKWKTPCYIYSKNYLIYQIKKFKNSFSRINSLICYSVKANSNINILKIMKENGLGADVVSEGELRRTLLAGFSPSKIVFAGVGKSEEEIEFGIKNDIFCFNVENEEEINLIENLGRKYKKEILCNLRLNLDIDIDTHHYVKTSRKETKFGLDLQTASKIIKRKYKYAKIKGFHLHLGSQIKEISPYIKAIEKVREFSKNINFFPEIIDIGGGFGIPYSVKDKSLDIEKFGERICREVEKLKVKLLILEPGRFIVGNTAIVVSKVLYVKRRKEKNFVIIDAGMNDLIRPAFYGSYHLILPEKKSKGKEMKADIVGPICESGDFLGKDVKVPVDIKRGDLIIIGNAGAYCFSMSSNYNSRRRPCEILVDGKKEIEIRKREEFEDLWKGEI